ncbi:oxidoreductase-like protein [Myriangium duriaei CBS 260.36]|uniref:Oxidoreductase-like protein n=1 Tax=Myriangium duriaei CBS 260.36 TaxID=1168546 RepID=A0A9P4MDH7_9PEZI|nr:oxidoreductase-like protein [Myriangium duriaei CBS 260.36]
MTTRNDFGPRTNGSEVAQAFSDRIKGRVVVITGVSPNSLGGTLAGIVAQHRPAKLILASRSLPNLQAVAKSITTTTSTCHPDLVELDLHAPSSICRSSQTISSLTSTIDLLINTAHATSSVHRFTRSGHEFQFAFHLGHYQLTNLLLPLLLHASSASPPGSVRIINTTSEGHRLSPIRFSDPTFQRFPIPASESPPPSLPSHLLPSAEQKYKTFIAYAQAKTADILHSLALTTRLDKEGVRSYAVHPGTINTSLPRNLSPADLQTLYAGTEGTWITPDQGVATLLVAALDPGLDKRQDGVYLSGCRTAKPARHARDPATAERLWGFSGRLVKEGEEVERRVGREKGKL